VQYTRFSQVGDRVDRVVVAVKLVYKFSGLQVPQPYDAVQRARRDVPTFSIPGLISAAQPRLHRALIAP
jgi:hypothetical protein